MPVAANPNVSPAVWTPDTYLYISTQPVTTGTRQQKNLLLLAPYLNSSAAMTGAPYSLTAGTAQVNAIEQRTSVDSVNTYYGRRSLQANAFRAALQAQPVGLNLFCAAVAEPTGSNFAGVATQLLGVVGTAVGSGELKIRIKGFLHRVAVANGDTNATIAAAILTAMGGVGGGTSPQQPDCPFVGSTQISGSPIATMEVIPVVCVHRGEVGNSKAIVADIPPEITGIYLSPGVITCATNAAGAGGNPSVFTIRCGSLSVSVSLAIGTTPANAATAIANAINAGTIGLEATTATADVVLKYRSGYAVHRIQCNSTEDVGGQTYTLKDRLNDTHAAIGSAATTAGSATYTGLQGTGTPTLTTVLANRAKKGPMLEWYSEYIDSTSLGAIATHIEQYANGYYQENQRCTLGSDEVLDATGTGLQNARTRITAPSPALTTSWRYALAHSQDAFSGISSAAVELAADLCATDLPHNFDRHLLSQGVQVPVLPPREDTELDAGSVDTAMRSYHLTVLKGSQGQVRVVRGVTTWGQANIEWSDFSYGRIFDDTRYRMRAHVNNRLSGKVLFLGTTPRVANAFTLRDVEDAFREVLLAQDGITIDGARELARYVVAEVDPDDGSFIRVACRVRPPREAHVKAGTLSSAPPLS